MKLLFASQREDILESVKKQLPNIEIVVCNSVLEISNLKEYDLIALTDYIEGITQEIIDNNRVINVHQSLLPSFPQKSALKDAYLNGVKVFGVSVHNVELVEKNILSGKIIAQYPVLIDNYTHFDELETEIKQLEQQLYPLVIKSILEDKVFDIVDFLSTPNLAHGCSGGCGGCHNCGKN